VPINQKPENPNGFVKFGRRLKSSQKIQEKSSNQYILRKEDNSYIINQFNFFH